MKVVGEPMGEPMKKRSRGVAQKTCQHRLGLFSLSLLPLLEVVDTLGRVVMAVVVIVVVVVRY